MTTTAKPKIAGKALYLELVPNPDVDESQIQSLVGWYGSRGDATKQIIVFPQYQDDTGEIYDPVIMTRTVSAHSPRAQWDTRRVSERLKPIAGELEENNYNNYVSLERYSREEWGTLTEREKYDSRKLDIELTLKRELLGLTYEGEGDEREAVAKQGWVVRDKKPIAVEITDQDLQELYNERKTPQAVIRRINKVRGTLDKFPAKLA